MLYTNSICIFMNPSLLITTRNSPNLPTLNMCQNTQFYHNQDMEHNIRSNIHFKKRKRTSKIIDRLTYCPKKHKQKHTKHLRKQLQTRDPPAPPKAPTPSTSIKFGSININGLDLEASWAVDQLISKRGFDVRHSYI